MPRLHTATQAYIDWSWDVEHIYRYILAFSEPYQGAKSYINGRKVYLYDAYVDKKVVHTHPYKYGIIFSIDDDNLKIACNGGSLVVSKYNIDGNYRPQLGDRFYTPDSILNDIYSSRVIYTADGLKES